MYYQLSLFGNQDLTPVSLKVLREKPGDRVLEGVAGLSVLELLSAVLGNPDTALRVLPLSAVDNSGQGFVTLGWTLSRF
jgi:hypothetical protein